MFNIGLGELLFIALLILVVIGPERLPQVMRQVGEYVAMIRRIVREFNREFAEELRPLHEIQGLADELNPAKQLGSLLSLDEREGQAKPGSKQRVTRGSVANPMQQIAQTDEAQRSRPGNAPPAAPDPLAPAANPMTLISQTMKTRAEEDDAGVQNQLGGIESS